MVANLVFGMIMLMLGLGWRIGDHGWTTISFFMVLFGTMNVLFYVLT